MLWLAFLAVAVRAVVPAGYMPASIMAGGLPYTAHHDVRDVAAPDDAIVNPGAPLSAYVGLRWRFR